MPDDRTPPTQPDTASRRRTHLRRAGGIALGVGIASGVTGALAAPHAPWWMPLLLSLLAAAVTWRLLQPRSRRIGWEDEV